MINRFFRAPSDDLRIQLFRYILSGAVACAVDYSVLVTLTQVFRLYYLTSAAIAFMLGSTVSYVLNITWVFDRRAFVDRRLEALLFFSIGFAGLFLNHYCIQFFTETVKLHYLGSKVISTIAVFAVNFSARKYILFRGAVSKSVSPANE
jgi:putative flippase GtrA